LMGKAAEAVILLPGKVAIGIGDGFHKFSGAFVGVGDVVLLESGVVGFFNGQDVAITIVAVVGNSVIAVIALRTERAGGAFQHAAHPPGLTYQSAQVVVAELFEHIFGFTVHVNPCGTLQAPLIVGIGFDEQG